MIRGVAAFYLKPLFASFMVNARATSSDSPATTRTIENKSGINKLREWSSSLLGSLQANAALAK